MHISEEHVIEEFDDDEIEFERDPPGVHVRYNDTVPSEQTDGVDFVAVIEEGDDTYRLDYRGYRMGRIRVTADGVAELGERLQIEPGGIPAWTVDPDTVDADDLPWWIPEETPIDASVSCERCEETVSVRDVCTPRQPPIDSDEEVFCRDCWPGY